MFTKMDCSIAYELNLYLQLQTDSILFKNFEIYQQILNTSTQQNITVILIRVYMLI